MNQRTYIPTERDSVIDDIVRKIIYNHAFGWTEQSKRRAAHLTMHNILRVMFSDEAIYLRANFPWLVDGVREEWTARYYLCPEKQPSRDFVYQHQYHPGQVVPIHINVGKAPRGPQGRVFP